MPLGGESSDVLKAMNWKAYEKPNDLREALRLLEQACGMGRVIAGGTDLMPQVRRGECHADLLVDITGIAALKGIKEEDGWIFIGAGVTHAEVAGHPILQREAKALAEGCRKVGSPQIRNMGTLVGNVVTAQPAADGAIPLMVLEAGLQVTSNQGERWVPLEDAYRGIGYSAIDATREIVTRVRFQRLGERAGTGFFRMARRKALALPIVNGAVSIKLSPSGKRVEKARIALGPVAEKPFRSREAEARLESGDLSHEILLAVSRIASEEANPRTSDRGGSAYRKEMVRVQLFRLLEKVVKEAREKG